MQHTKILENRTHSQEKKKINWDQTQNDKDARNDRQGFYSAYSNYHQLKQNKLMNNKKQEISTGKRNNKKEPNRKSKTGKYSI